MSFSNFKIENDGDGIAVVTWDSPGRSMNVIDASVMDELSAIIDQTTADAAVKGVVITSSKDAFCAGASRLAASLGSPPSTAPRLAAASNWRWPVIAASPPTVRARASASPRSRSD